MSTETALLDKNGRLFIPAAIRRQMGWQPGDVLTLSPAQDELRILSRRQAIDLLRAEVRKLVPPGVSMVDELIRERREEARREEKEFKRSLARQRARTRRQTGESRG